MEYKSFSNTQLLDAIDSLLTRAERDEALRVELAAQLENIYNTTPWPWPTHRSKISLAFLPLRYDEAARQSKKRTHESGDLDAGRPSFLAARLKAGAVSACRCFVPYFVGCARFLANRDGEPTCDLLGTHFGDVPVND
jgi:hypothetical protein